MIPYAFLILSVLLGGISLVGFAFFLAFGPPDIIPLSLDLKTALAWDSGLCLAFFGQHSVMIRRPFRDRLGRVVPERYQPALYSIASGVLLMLLVVLWQPTSLVLLSVEGPGRWVLRGLFLTTGPVFLWAIRSLGTFDTFGLEPIRAHLRGSKPRTMPLAIRGPYRWVRHPLYGLFIVMAWTFPDITADRLLFNVLFTGWIVLGTVLEERDLVRELGDSYRAYQRQVPMLVPWRRPLTALLLAITALAACGRSTPPERPNAILIVTDDQGYGDLGVNGNPVIRTPHIDAMAARSARMTRFYVSPVCAPTRASLMTGRYNYRTRAIDTYIGRAMMEPEEVTLAEILRDAGYRTGIFGKWHLGDNYPMRPIDQGFEEALVHRGGGIGQPSDPPGGEGKYTDAILFHNGEAVQTEGYCTDVYFDRALEWIEARREAGEPFFAYIPTNAPHGPFHDVPEDLLAEYREVDLGNGRFPQDRGHPLPDEADLDRRARIFAMITNVDENVGRLFERLDALDLTKDTIVMFMVDNGPNGNRYVAGMKGWKGHVHEGGVRSPFFVHWPGRLPAGHSSDRIAAHIDVMPTVLEATGVPVPEGLRVDGRSLLPLLAGDPTEWPDRQIVVQAHRGNVPVRYHHFLLRGPRYKLVHPSGFGEEGFEGEPAFELYDMEADPLELEDLADERPEVVAELRVAYDAWFDDVSHTRPDNYAPPRIVVGSPHEKVTVLTRQDWRHTKGRPWAPDSNGHWELEVATTGEYDVRLRFPPMEGTGTALLRLNDDTRTADLARGSDGHVFEAVPVEAGPLRLQANLERGGDTRGPWQVDVTPR
jgi:arylsulfatase/arylsulfatase A